MARLFSDGFDTYTSPSDVVTAWGSGAVGGDAIVTAANTAFGTGQALGVTANTSGSYQASWASNEATVFFSLRYKIPTGGSSSNYISFGFTDAATRQLSIRFNLDGSIGIYSGGPTGTLLGTIATGTIAVGAWNSLQGQVVFNNTTGSVTLRLNGSTSAFFTLTNVNTRGGTTNAYANGHSLVAQFSSGASVQFDDLFINSASGAAPTSWPGDLRAIQQLPNGTTQAQFSIFPAAYAYRGSAASASSSTLAANTLLTSQQITTVQGGTISTLSIATNTSYTGKYKLALYATSGGLPGTLLGETAEQTNATGAATITLSLLTPVTVTAGQVIWGALLCDTSSFSFTSFITGGFIASSLSRTYSLDFPAAFGGGALNTTNPPTITVNVAPGNYVAVSDTAEDGDTSYVVSSTVGQEDIYTLSAVPTTYAVVGVEYYVWWRKSDAGARTAQLSVQANGSADTAEITNAALGNSYTYSTKFLATDPTGAGWTPTTANGAKIGISVTA